MPCYFYMHISLYAAFSLANSLEYSFPPHFPSHATTRTLQHGRAAPSLQVKTDTLKIYIFNDIFACKYYGFASHENVYFNKSSDERK